MATGGAGGWRYVRPGALGPTVTSDAGAGASEDWGVPVGDRRAGPKHWGGLWPAGLAHWKGVAMTSWPTGPSPRSWTTRSPRCNSRCGSVDAGWAGLRDGDGVPQVRRPGDLQCSRPGRVERDGAPVRESSCADVAPGIRRPVGKQRDASKSSPPQLQPDH